MTNCELCGRALSVAAGEQAMSYDREMAGQIGALWERVKELETAIADFEVQLSRMDQYTYLMCAGSEWTQLRRIERVSGRIWELRRMGFDIPDRWVEIEVDPEGTSGE